MLGTDIKAFINDPNFKINKNNKPRIFANTIKITKNENTFDKSVFTYVTTDKMINVLRGQFKLQKYYTIERKKQFFMIMQL